MTGEAFQGHRWGRGDKGGFRQALPLPSPPPRRPRCEGTPPPRARPLPTGPNWRSRGRGAPGEMDSPGRDRQLGSFGGHWRLCRGEGPRRSGPRTLGVLVSKMQDRTGGSRPGEEDRGVRAGPSVPAGRGRTPRPVGPRRVGVQAGRAAPAVPLPGRGAPPLHRGPSGPRTQ